MQQTSYTEERYQPSWGVQFHGMRTFGTHKQQVHDGGAIQMKVKAPIILIERAPADQVVPAPVQGARPMVTGKILIQGNGFMNVGEDDHRADLLL
jgi:hypothetical protein